MQNEHDGRRDATPFRMTRRGALLGGASSVLLVACASGAGRDAPIRIRAVGLSGPIEIADDRWGIPHVTAATVPDAFLGHGYVCARDRLWQMDFDRRRALGRLSAVFGKPFLPSDTANRLFLFQGDAAAELARYPTVVQDSARGFVAGINAYLAECVRDPSLLPPEFPIFDYTPEPWDVLDLIRIRAEPVGNTAAEVRRAQLAARGALDLDHLMVKLQPDWQLVVPAGLDVHAVSERDLGWLGVLQAELPLGPGLPATLHQDPAGRRANEGSNAWVIAPKLTETGRPILANDPHLSIGTPGPRYIAHLTAPGLNVIGAGLPGMIGIMQGHNEHIAWGRTNFHIDQEDLFILRTDPDNPDRYAHGGDWRVLERKTEVIAVRGGEPEIVTLCYSIAGPVLSEDHARHRAVAVSATWLQPGVNGSLANIGINMARDWHSFREALRVHSSPTNFVYADVAGHIGWQAAGRVPIRPKHDGLLPAPGDGSYDWLGLQTLEDLPASLDPPEGWFATSNQMNLPADYPYASRKVSFEWSEPFRYRRVADVLREPGRKSIAGSVQLQHDTLSGLALRTVKLLPDIATHPSLQPAIRLLKGWNGDVTADSAAASLYEVWWSELTQNFHELVVPDQCRDLIGPISPSVQISMLEAPSGSLGSARTQLLTSTLRTALDWMQKNCGADMTRWRWGDLHRVALRHPLSGNADVARTFPVIDGGRSGGDPYTVMARWLKPGHAPGYDFSVRGGASYAMVLDVGAWDNSRMLYLPGQSGDPRSVHYRDFYQSWIEGEARPLFFSRALIEPQIVRRTVLF